MNHPAIVSFQENTVQPNEPTRTVKANAFLDLYSIGTPLLKLSIRKYCEPPGRLRGEMPAQGSPGGGFESQTRVSFFDGKRAMQLRLHVKRFPGVTDFTNITHTQTLVFCVRLIFLLREMFKQLALTAVLLRYRPQVVELNPRGVRDGLLHSFGTANPRILFWMDLVNVAFSFLHVARPRLLKLVTIQSSSQKRHHTRRRRKTCNGYAQNIYYIQNTKLWSKLVGRKLGATDVPL